MVECSRMRIKLYNKGKELPVSPFIGKFIGNVCPAVAASLKGPRPAKTLRLELEGDSVRIQVDGVAVPLDKSQGFAETISRDTLLGMIRHLKGVDPGGLTCIEMEFEGHP
jgi:hypothetical protein